MNSSLCLFHPFILVGSWICRGLNCPRLPPKIGSCSALQSLGHSSPRIGPSDSLRANGPDPQIVGPHNSPSKPFYPTSGLERRVLANPGPEYGPFSLIPHLCERFPRKSAGFQGIPSNPLGIYSCRLDVPDAPLNEFPSRGIFMSGGSTDKVGKRNGRLFFFRFFWKL